jgi:hypothetical protein
MCLLQSSESGEMRQANRAMRSRILSVRSLCWTTMMMTLATKAHFRLLMSANRVWKSCLVVQMRETFSQSAILSIHACKSMLRGGCRERRSMFNHILLHMLHLCQRHYPDNDYPSQLLDMLVHMLQSLNYARRSEPRLSVRRTVDRWTRK